MEVEEACGVSECETDTKPEMEAEACMGQLSPLPSPSHHTPPEDEFVWEEYLEETQTEAVPPTAFLHVEKSLESGVLADQLVEVVHFVPEQQPCGYWLAKVVTTCGPLLRLRYITGSNANVECWREVVCGGLRPVGWCCSHNIPLSVPPDLSQALSEGDSEEVARGAVMAAEREGMAVAEEALEVDGYTAVDRIKQGMKVEVLLSGEGLCGWVATVMENVGGRLLLRYDTPDCSGDTFWLFYQHPRLRPPDWIHHHRHMWKYQPPSSCSGYEEAEWGALLELSRADAHHSPMPSSLLAPPPQHLPHHLHQGVRLEVVHPSRPHVVCVGVVAEVLNEHYFRLELDVKAEEGVSWITSLSDPLVLPCGFCKENNLVLLPPKDWENEACFDWSLYTNFELASKDVFPDFESAESLGFLPGMRLEAVNPQCPNQICAATVKQTYGHLLVIQLDSEPDTKPVIHSATSQDLFPTGWAQANNYPLQLPTQYCPRPRRDHSPIEDENHEKLEDGGATGETVVGGRERSMWCPRLYINHWCYTGPYLSKSKVAKQSQSVGPGSVELVLREVLAATINAAYIPTRVLREIQRNAPDPSTVPSTWRLTPFKAKFKRYNYTANIAIATTASDVSEFLYNICGTLQCCPNLWSTVPSGENCPLLCTAQMGLQGTQSTGVRGRGRISLNRGIRGVSGSARIIHRRKRGGRKRLFVPIKANRLLQTKTLTASPDDVIEDLDEEDDGELDDGDEEDVSGSDEGDTSSRSSRPTSPCIDRRRKPFPRFDIQAKGMKLPEDASQIKMKHTKKRFDLQEGGPSVPGYREEPFERREHMKRNRRNYYSDTNCGLEPATVTSDPLDWTVHDVEQYVAGQPAISHHAVKLREQEVDGRAFLLLNLPTLVQHLGLPHSSAVALAQHICRVKLAHFLFFYRAEG